MHPLPYLSVFLVEKKWRSYHRRGYGRTAAMQDSEGQQQQPLDNNHQNVRDLVSDKVSRVSTADPVADFRELLAASDTHRIRQGKAARRASADMAAAVGTLAH